MARIAGLRLRDRWGGWNAEPYTATSWRHISVYERGPSELSTQYSDRGRKGMP